MRRQLPLSTSPGCHTMEPAIVEQGGRVSKLRSSLTALASSCAHHSGNGGAEGGDLSLRTDRREYRRRASWPPGRRDAAARPRDPGTAPACSARGGYELVDLSGLTAEIEKAAPLHKCGGCEVDIAHRAGAEIAITGTVRKVPNLILGFTIEVRDVSTGRLTRVLQASIRGNTDEFWLRGIRWLVANRLLVPEGQR